VHDMKIHERDDDLVVATHGRGIYVLDIAPLAGLTSSVLAQEAHLFQPEPEIDWIASDRTNYASSNFEGESEEPGASLYYWLRGDADVTLTIYQGGLAIRQIEAEGTPGIHVAQWDLQRWIERSPEEQEQMRSRRGGGGGGGGFGRGPSAEDRIRYDISDAAPGQYRVVLTVGGTSHERTVTVMKDEWWNER
jgi:hypothetical protein